MARNEKEYKHSRLVLAKIKAQSTLEYALIFPILLLMILGIFELSFLWHQYNTVELATIEISANISLLNDFGCNNSVETQNIIRRKTSILSNRQLTFNYQKNGNENTYTSNEVFQGSPIAVVKIDCTSDDRNIHSLQSAPTVQLQAKHQLMFFSASLPNFRTGERIIIIPNNVNLVSTKKVTLGQN